MNERILKSRNKREGGYCGKSCFLSPCFMARKARHLRAGAPEKRDVWSPRSLREWSRA